MRGYAKIGAVVLCAAAVIGFGSAAAASSTDKTTTAKQCADGHSTSAKLGAADYKLIEHFIVCLGKQWLLTPSPNDPVTGGEGGFDSLGGIPGVTSVLNSFAKDPKSDDDAHFIATHLAAAKDSQFRDASIGDIGCFWDVIADTTPQSPSLATVADWVDDAHAGLVKTGVQNFLRTTALVEKGAWFHDGSSKNVRFAVVFAGGSTRGHADCSK
jgi:hypothetical protein